MNEAANNLIAAIDCGRTDILRAVIDALEKRKKFVCLIFYHPLALVRHCQCHPQAQGQLWDADLKTCLWNAGVKIS